MGVAFYWAPVKPGEYLPVGARSNFRTALVELFGEFPIRLTADSVPMLMGLRAGLGEAESIDALVDAIQRHGEIDVRAEW